MSVPMQQKPIQYWMRARTKAAENSPGEKLILAFFRLNGSFFGFVYVSFCFGIASIISNQAENFNYTYCINQPSFRLIVTT